MPESGREEAVEEQQERTAEKPIGEAAGKAAEEAAQEAAEAVAGAPEPDVASEADEAAEEAAAGVPATGAEADRDAAEEKSDAKAELEADSTPEPTLRLVKAVRPEPEPEPEPARTPTVDAEPVPEPAAKVEPEPAPEPPAEETVEPPAAMDRGAGRRRLKAALWPPRLSRGQLVVALLLFSLGLGLAIQVRSTNDHHSQLRGARQEDLVRILDELDSRQQRLQQEKAELEQSLAKLENSSNQAKEAQEQTRKKVTELGVLAGTVKATGPGIVLTVDDPQGQVKADMLLDTLQELRAAGAEAIQINDVRVVVNTYFTDLSGGGVQIDGKKASQPYRFTVVGNPQDLTPALNIPGGVVRTLESHQARATISQQQKVVVDALVDLKTPQYAKPASK
ncbi:DUF881 domain-containing protein [Kitasatospora sp. NPDC093550]|uniref:DUF881 domain-containing protein n=1 Tax=Kitasatospora sp. NPDC093550 TaxID=3364089 RepID=UPI00380D0AB1